MLRSGKELKVFAVKDTDLQRFCKEAKRYGVLYCVLKDRDAADGITDIMVRAEDASKINRIFERFQLSKVDMASIKSEIERSRGGSGEPGPPVTERAASEGASPSQDMEAFLNALFQPEQDKEEQGPNPTTGRTLKSPRSEPISNQTPDERGSADGERAPSRPSVRKELAQIKQAQKQRAAQAKEPEPDLAAPQALRKKKSKIKIPKGELTHGEL
jgi:hypothetical protein